MSPQSIDGPCTYFFVENVYYADPTATNAVITVAFYPGNSSWTGSVGFTTEDGTAHAGEEYTAVSGTIWFSGPAPRTFSVPIRPSCSPGDKTVKLSLVKIASNSIVTTGSATLVLRGAPSPTLAITPGANNSVRLSWPATYTNYVVETSTGLSSVPGDWSVMPAPSKSSDEFFVQGSVQEPRRFFRLRLKESR